jgi:hypothetical protein
VTETVRDDGGTHWGLYLKCEQVCGSPMGEPCYDLTSGGPGALPPHPLSVPHVSRKLSRAKSGDPAPAKPAASRTAGVVARRKQARTESVADAWRKLADKRGST